MCWVLSITQHQPKTNIRERKVNHPFMSNNTAASHNSATPASKLTTTIPEPVYAHRVTEATIKTQSGAQGVLIPGGFILTATHCLSWDAHYHHPDNYISNTIATRAGQEILTRVVFADPASDLAVLGWTSDDDPEAASALEAWCATPIQISEPLAGTPVHILTHLGEWMRGEIVSDDYSIRIDGRFCILTDREIPSGTSGGSVVDDEGRIVGVVSVTVSTPSPHQSGKYIGTCPAVCLALPQWVLNRIREEAETR
jgi:S1-C subfamily serine protease